MHCDTKIADDINYKCFNLPELMLVLPVKPGEVNAIHRAY